MSRKTLILYASQYGYGAECANQLRSLMPEEVTLVDLTKATNPELDGYDTIIVGGSVYMGKAMRQTIDFCAANESALLQRKLGLFLCCGLPQNVEQSFAASFSEPLRKHATVSGCFGGELRLGKMKPMHKMIANMMQKAGGKSGIEPPKPNPKAINEFASAMQSN